MADPTVLVLDDDRGVRDVLAMFLGRYGYRAVCVRTIDEAVEALRTEPVEALILDVRLQGPETGIDLLASVRQRLGISRAPVLILTGGVVSEAEEMAITRHRGFLFYKPEGYDTLINFLDNLTGRERAH